MNAQNDDVTDADLAATMEAIKFAYRKKPRNAAELARWIKVAIPHRQGALATRILKRAADILEAELDNDPPPRGP
jgi:hypothetical protein